MDLSSSGHHSVDTERGLVGWPWRATVLILGALSALDILLTVSGGSRAWPAALVLLLAVPVTAMAGLRGGGRRLFVGAGGAAALSLVASTGLPILGTVDHRWAVTDFGLAEGAALTLVLVACLRRAAGRRTFVCAGVALAVFVLPLRLGWYLDVVPFLLAALTVTAVAAATASVLRASDASHRLAVTTIRRVEREAMARELHDVVAHHVTGMVVLTQAARSIVGELPVPDAHVVMVPGTVIDPRLRDALASVERAGADALTALRSMVAVLRSSDPDGGPAPREPAPTGADLEELVRRFEDSGVVAEIDLTVATTAHALPPPVQAALHRVVQESLTNVTRYARGAEWVRVQVGQVRECVVVTVSDSGGLGEQAPGPEGVPWHGGFGIIGMRERVGVLGGALEAGPDPGGGWTVRAEVPR